MSVLCGREKLGNAAPASGGMRSAAAVMPGFAGLAQDLEAARNAPGTTAHARAASRRLHGEGFLRTIRPRAMQSSVVLTPPDKQAKVDLAYFRHRPHRSARRRADHLAVFAGARPSHVGPLHGASAAHRRRSSRSHEDGGAGQSRGSNRIRSEMRLNGELRSDPRPRCFLSTSAVVG